MMQLENLEDLLPPHWLKFEEVDLNGDVSYIYVNEITGEESTVHPFHMYVTKSSSGNSNQDHSKDGNVKNNNLDDFAFNNEFSQHPNNLFKEPFNDGSYVDHFRPKSGGIDGGYNEYDNNEENKQSYANEGDYRSLKRPNDYNTDKQSERSPLTSPPKSSDYNNTIDTDKFNYLQQSPKKPGTAGTGRFANTKAYDYFCQWSERDLYGKYNVYRMTIRYYAPITPELLALSSTGINNNHSASFMRQTPNQNNGSNCNQENDGGIKINNMAGDDAGTSRTLIRFDGIQDEWVFTQLKGPYGAMEQIDFYIGAKVTVFGRHLSITSASASSVRWIEAKKKMLEKEQLRLRQAIQSIGKVPCAGAALGGLPPVQRHITRSTAGRPPGSVDLRRLSNENAKLGEQIAELGLTPQVFP